MTASITRAQSLNLEIFEQGCKRACIAPTIHSRANFFLEKLFTRCHQRTSALAPHRGSGQKVKSEFQLGRQFEQIPGPSQLYQLASLRESMSTTACISA
jgi:hypothetical protein